MTTSDQRPLSPAGRVIVGLAALAAGVLPILAALDLGPLHHEDIHGPPWIAGAAGAAFVLAGLAIVIGSSARMRWLGSLAGLLCVAALAAVGNWIAFGVGERQCTGTLSAFFWTSSRVAGNLECRLAFGIGAALLDGMLLWGAGAALVTHFGAALLPRAIQAIGKAIVLTALAPFLLVLVVAVLAKGLAASAREYWQTGRWPRNEGLRARLRGRAR
jgi:hypothetical protein